MSNAADPTRSRDAAPALPPPVVLCIAGSDSSAGAGIQADLLTCHRVGALCRTVITAVTAQNSRGVQHVHPLPIDVVRAQLEACAADVPIAAVKLGMLATAEVVRVVAELRTWLPEVPWVIDPVLVSSSGTRLLSEAGQALLCETLLPGAVITPNAVEAEALTGVPVAHRDAQIDAGRTLLSMGARAAVIKGGHLLPSADAADVLVSPRGALTRHIAPVSARSSHGTGCTHASALAAHLAMGDALEDAFWAAHSAVHAALAAAPGLGGPGGPLGHHAIPAHLPAQP